MTIWEISEKADYIAQRHRRLQDQWHIYCNSLVQGITLSKARLHHAMSCAPDKDLCFVLFEHFRITVTMADGFNSHTIEYYVETKDSEDKQLIAQAQLSIDGKVDERVSNQTVSRCWNTISIKSPASMTDCMPPLRADRRSFLANWWRDKNRRPERGVLRRDVVLQVVTTI